MLRISLLIVSMLFGCASSAEPSKAPLPLPSASKLSEDEQMVEALRAKMVELHEPMDMVALSIRRVDDWAWLVGQPRPPGTHDDDSFDPVQGLLHKVSGTWKLADIACTEDGNAACIGGAAFVEVGRDERTSHHIVALRGREPVHIHAKHDLLVYCFEGEGGMLIGDEERRIGRGSIVYVPRGTVHSMRNTSSMPMLGYAVFTPPFDGKDRVPATDPLPADQ